MNALILAVHDGVHLDPATGQLVTAARQLVGGDGVVHVLVLAKEPAPMARAAARLSGVTLVMECREADGVAPVAEALAVQLAELGCAFRWVLGANTIANRAALPRAAAACGGAYLADVVGTDIGQIVRAAYTGLVLTRIASNAEVTFATVRCSSFVAAGAAGAAQRRSVDATPAAVRCRRLDQTLATGDRPKLGRADVVVAGGRGVGSADNMERLVGGLALRLNAAVGASRAAVDAGYVTADAQVGQTGKVIAPDLYVAAGISGAIQHLAGIKDAKCIVAINKDPDAPIFQIADIGYVGDLFEVLPHLAQALPDRTPKT